MNRKTRWSWIRACRDESGQALPFLLCMTVLSLGFAGLTIDLGRAYVSYRQLQSSTDAAALAGAYAMAQTNATAQSVSAAVTSYSAASGGANANSNFASVTVSTNLECLTSVTNSGVYCSASTTGDNALQVTQTATLNTFFIRALGALGLNAMKTMTISATSTAAMRGASNEQYNVAIVIDTTASMKDTDSDSSCGTNSTRITCALAGVRTLLQSLTPCAPPATTSSCTAFDQVSLFTFPNFEASTASKDTTCPTGNPTVIPYSLPTAGATWSAPTGTAPTYQITGYLSNYSSTNQAGGALNTSSALTIAAGGKSGCNGLATPGGDGTYFAGAIYAAQSSLIAAQKANPGSLNAMVILSDGDASASSDKICVTWSTSTPSSCSKYATSNGTTYGSSIDQCQQAITAAQAATAAGTTVYSIAYGAASSGCSTDTSGPLAGISPCTTMQDLASTPGDFYSDSTASQNQGQCTSSANPSLSLQSIFKQVATSFTVARLIPNNAT